MSLVLLALVLQTGMDPRTMDAGINLNPKYECHKADILERRAYIKAIREALHTCSFACAMNSDGRCEVYPLPTPTPRGAQ